MKKIFFYILFSISLIAIDSCSDKEDDVKINLNMTKLETALSCSDTLNDCYGICAHITRKDIDYPYIEGILNVMDELHITWVRSDMDWYTMNSTPNGELDFTLFDDVFAHLEKHPNIHLLPIITLKNNKYPYLDNAELTIQTYHKDWQKYIKGLITRYQEKCSVWEGFNEWDQYLNNGMLSYKEGTEYQKEIYDIAKGCNSDLMVLSGSICTADPIYMNLASFGYYAYCDIINRHSYSTLDPEMNYINWIDYMSKVDKLNNMKKSLWLTEFGYSTSLGRRTEEEQAYYIPRTFITGFAKGIDKIFLYSMRSKENNTDEPEDHYGITHKDLSPKPAYYAYKNLITMLPNKSTRPVLYNLGLIYLASWVHPQLGKVYAIWTKEGSMNVNMQYQGNPHCYSYKDVDSELKIEDYRHFEIGPGIIYITGIDSLSLS